MKHFMKILTNITLVLAVSISNINIIPAYASEEIDAPLEEDVEEFSTDDVEKKAVLKIKAFSPGYSIDGVQNVGEYIELANVSEESIISLTGFYLRYTNSSGNRSNIIEFPEGSQMAGETLLLRLSSSPEAEDADYKYSKTIALEAGPLELVYLDKVVDTVCWKGKNCLSKFTADSPTSIVQDLLTGEFSHSSEYSPEYGSARQAYIPPKEENDEDDDGLIENPPTPKCYGLNFNEVYSYYEDDQSEQFIEFYNPTSEPIELDGCHIRYKKKLYSVSGVVMPEGYYVRAAPDFTLTKNPTTSNLIELLDATGEIVDTVEYYHGQEKGASLALFGYDEEGAELWQITYAPTPGAENVLQEYRSCPAGKIINEITGNCVKATTLKTAEVECPEGKYRNPLTGRCKKIETNETAECKKGYERNPETGRCRKIKDSSAANHALVPETGDEKTNFVALAAVGGTAAVALGYVVFQFRHELANVFRRIGRFKK